MIRRKSNARWFAYLLAGVFALGLACGEDKPQGPAEGEESTAIRIDALIVVPKSAEPDDTVSLSVQISSNSQNVGDFPVVKWTASGGDFVDDDKLAVQWVAPSVPQIYQINCEAKNSVNTVSASVNLFVGGLVTLIPERAGEMRMFPNLEDFYYLSTTDIDEGVEVYSFIDSVEADAIPGHNLGQAFAFSPDLSAGAFHQLTYVVGDVLDYPFDVYLDDIAAGTETKITTDKSPGSYRRKHQNKFPYLSPDGNIIAYQSMHPAKFVGEIDTFDLYVYYRNSMTTVAVTDTSHGPIQDRGRRRNFFPTFSTDGRWMTFVSDRVRAGSYELYGLPVAGGVVATDSSSVMKLTATGGTVVPNVPPTSMPRPTMRWNPVQPVIGVITAAGALRLADVTGTPNGTGTPVTGISGSVRDFRWSQDGQMLVLSTGTGLYTADLSGASTLQHQAASGDNIRDMAWSPDKLWIIYRVQRSSVAWFEILDVGAGLLDEPVVLTQAVAAGGLSAYGRSMDMSPRFAAGNRLYMLSFYTSPTPRVEWLDLSTVLP